VPVAVINTPTIQKMGLKAGPFARWMLRGRKRKHWMRMIYAIKSLHSLKKASLSETADYWQAGKSVAGITSIEPAASIVRRFAEAARSAS
jgi:nitronate monooxygenase